MVGFFELRWAGVASSGWTGANEQAGDVVLDEVLVEVDEEMAETLISTALLAREEGDEWVEYD